MAKTTYIQTNFTAGEVTPRLRGRPDVSRYQNGAESMENVLISVHGGAYRRPGQRYLATAKHSGARKVDVVRYVFNVDQAYLLEFGHQYIRFFASNGAQLLDDSMAPLEIASPYTEDQIFQITRCQGGDTMFLFHPDVATHRLRRLGGSQWVLDPVPWVAEPFAEIGHSPNAKLTLSAATVGSGRTATTVNTTVPDPPTIDTAVAQNASAYAVFTPPGNDGGTAITQYTATSSPSGIAATGTGSPILVQGLANGVAYTFTVTATNAVGTSASSAASNSVTPLSSLPSGTLTASITPSPYSVDVVNGTRNVVGPLASSTGGVSPFTYSWAVVGGSGVTILTPAAAQPTLQSSGFSVTRYATLRCTITDSQGRVGTQSVNVSITHEPRRTDDGGIIP